MIHPALFYTVSGLITASALGVILARRPIYAVLSLVLVLFGLSTLFVCLHAFFVAAIQIVVYAGAVLVLFLFVVMLLEMEPEPLLRARNKTMMGVGILFGFFFLWQLAVVVKGLPPATGKPLPGTTAAIGQLLFTTYALPFEAASLLLLVGIIGAIVLAKKKL
jgi:NADH-quinone oxidoreductase subunit J